MIVNLWKYQKKRKQLIRFTALLILPFVLPATQEDDLIYREQYVTPSGTTKKVHSASLVQMNNGYLRAIWFGGSREGGKDVSLYTATSCPNIRSWSKPKMLFNRNIISNDLSRHIRRIRNPVLFNDPKGKL